MPVTRISRNNVHLIRDRLEKRLKAFEDVLNLKATIGSIRYTDNNATIKLTLSVIGATGEAQTPERDFFKLYAKMYGLSPALLDKQVVGDRDVYTIVGYRPKARVNKFVIARRDGKRFVVPFIQLKRWIQMDKNLAKYLDDKAIPDYGKISDEVPDEIQNLLNKRRENV